MSFDSLLQSVFERFAGLATQMGGEILLPAEPSLLSTIMVGLHTYPAASSGQRLYASALLHLPGAFALTELGWRPEQSDAFRMFI